MLRKTLNRAASFDFKRDPSKKERKNRSSEDLIRTLKANDASKRLDPQKTKQVEEPIAIIADSLHITRRDGKRKNQRGRASTPTISIRDTSIDETEDKRVVVIIDEIGKGATSTVYSCYVDGFMCAMKEISFSQSFMDPSKELKILQNLPNHPNVIRFLFDRQTQTHLQIFLQFYHTTLADMISERKELFSVAQIVHILQQIAAGLHALHQQKLIHRDLKAHNIFVTTSTRGNTFVIGDMDTAYRIGKKKRPSTLIGTPSFMAPEVLQSQYDDLEYSFPADIYSFGMMMFHIMTLHFPFHDLKSFEISPAILGGHFPSYSLPETYDALVQLHHECITFIPKHRPTTTQLLCKLATLKETMDTVH